MDKIVFDHLLSKYLLEAITEDENRQLFAMLEEPEYQELLRQQVSIDLETGAFGSMESKRLTERLLAGRAGVPQAKKGRIIILKRIAVAAAVLLVIVTGGWWWRQQNRHPVQKEELAVQSIPPGKNGAILTLADGRKINLDSAANGSVTSQGNVKLIKINGQLAYNAVKDPSSATGKGTAVLYNTITTPPAHQLQLLLADGSKVWLNASSSIRFPAAFTGGERNVELTGEGYFEVEHNPMPFTVSVSDMKVQVLGTDFDVMAYKDESAIKTTLLRGSVKVTQAGKSKLIHPGEQAQAQGNEITVRQDADLEEAVAWKNGIFLLKGLDVASVFRQVGRWYDVEIIYKGAIPLGHLEGDFPRTMTLDKVQDGLRQFGIRTELEGRKLIVLP